MNTNNAIVTGNFVYEIAHYRKTGLNNWKIIARTKIVTQHVLEELFKKNKIY